MDQLESSMTYLIRGIGKLVRENRERDRPLHCSHMLALIAGYAAINGYKVSGHMSVLDVSYIEIILGVVDGRSGRKVEVAEQEDGGFVVHVYRRGDNGVWNKTSHSP